MNRISGHKRRETKKRLFDLRHYVKMFWHIEEASRAHGTGMDDKECERLIAQAKKEIHDIETALSEKT